MTATTDVDDDLLSALDQVTNTIYWYNDRHPLDAGTALSEAIGDWISEHSSEYHQSQPFADTVNDDDALATILDHFLAAVAHLSTSGARPGLSTNTALTEALGEWANSSAAEHHHDQLFQRPTER
jgi:hypothetical protein